MNPRDGEQSPSVVQEAQDQLQSLRERLGLAGGSLVVAGLIAHAIGAPFVVPAVAAGLAGVGVLYLVPPTARGRWARRVMERWRSEGRRGLVEFGQPVDQRVDVTEAMVDRIRVHAGSTARSTIAADELYRSVCSALDDLAVVGVLGRADQEVDGTGLEERAKSIRTQIDKRIDTAVDAVAEIYEAVLGHDEVALRRVLSRVDEELRHLRAEVEVERLLDQK